MQNIAELYENDSDYFCAYNYQPLLESFEYEIVLQVDDSDYQGDSRVLFKNGDLYGYLNFGWGSCSGCDALQACNNIKEVEELRDTLHNSIHWDTKENMLDYFQSKDWELEYSWHVKETREFVEQVINLLKE
jgi:hypothetical protein